MTPKQKSYAIASLRRASYRWGPRSEASKEARVSRGKYSCAICKEVFTYGETNMDHKDPVVDPVTGWVSFDVFIERLFVEKEGWQRICKSCHDVKTTKENGNRTRKTRVKRGKT